MCCSIITKTFSCSLASIYTQWDFLVFSYWNVTILIRNITWKEPAPHCRFPDYYKWHKSPCDILVLPANQNAATIFKEATTSGSTRTSRSVILHSHFSLQVVVTSATERSSPEGHRHFCLLSARLIFTQHSAKGVANSCILVGLFATNLGLTKWSK